MSKFQGHIIRPEYSSEDDDFDEYDLDYVPRTRVNFNFQKDYKTELKDSIMYESTEDFIKLLKNNNNNTDVEYDGWSPLMVAASYGQHEKMKYLLELGEDPNYNYNLLTPLLAVYSSLKKEDDLLECIKLLIEHGASLEVEDRHSVTPLMNACKNGYTNIVKYLLTLSQKNINKTDSESCTALTYAVMKNHPSIVQLLLDAKARNDIFDLYGRKPLDIAITKQYSAIINLLDPNHESEITGEYSDKKVQANISNDYIEVLKNNLPHSDIQRTGFYSNVIDMLNTEELSHITEEFRSHNTSFYEYLNLNSNQLKQQNLLLNCYKYEILNNVKIFHMYKYKLAKSILDTKETDHIVLDEFISYIYSICEQLYVDYCSLNYIKYYEYNLKNLKEKYKEESNDNDAKEQIRTLYTLSLLLSKYERYITNVLIENNCNHHAGLIEEENNHSKYFIGLPVLAIGITTLVYYIRK